jgi:hypothetical protein
MCQPYLSEVSDDRWISGEPDADVSRSIIIERECGKICPDSVFLA